MSRSTIGPDRWRELVLAQQRSGLSLRAFAARHGVSPNTLAYWKYKRGRGRAPAAAQLVPVEVIGEVSPSSELVVELADARVRVPAGCDPERAARLIALLLRPC